MSKFFPVLAEIPYKVSLRENFQTNQLYEDWFEKYPKLFDERDFENAKNQARYGSHFHEWLGAILLFQMTGWYSLQQKYQFKKHERKQKILRELGAQSLIKFFENQKENNFGSRQPPDLLVYSPDYSDWFMCEIKGPEDKLRKVQKEYFQALENETETQIQILKLDLL